MALKYCIFRLSGSLVFASMLLSPSALAQSDPSGNWLDDTTNWNTADAALPEAPTYAEGNNLPECEISSRPVSVPEDEQVTAMGWTLTGAAQINGATTIVQGMANADGMCRPLDYQVFVFHNGVFAGTLSPVPMDSRSDGSLSDYDLYREGYIGATFNRYTPEDALCCPSGTSHLSYEVEMQDDRPILVPQLPADTSPNR